MLNTILNTSPIRASRSSTFCFQAPSIYNVDIPLSQSLGALNRATPVVRTCTALSPVQSLGLASRRKSRQGVSFGHPLAVTLVELKFVRKSTHVFHRLATQRKSTQFDYNMQQIVTFFLFYKWSKKSLIRW